VIGVKTSISDRATPVTLAIAASVQTDLLKPIVGRAGVNVFKRHFNALDRSEPNALGGARTHFYRRVANSAHFDEVGDGVVVSVNEIGVRQRIVGGTIRPKAGKKFLTIPVAPEAHGKRAGQFTDLVVIWDRNGRPVGLGQKDNSQIGTSRGGKVTGASGVHMLYRLAKSAQQQPNPSIAVSMLELGAGVKSSVNAVIDRQVARARGQANGGNA
jgi:hypothetical protein